MFITDETKMAVFYCKITWNVSFSCHVSCKLKAIFTKREEPFSISHSSVHQIAKNMLVKHFMGSLAWNNRHISQLVLAACEFVLLLVHDCLLKPLALHIYWPLAKLYIQKVTEGFNKFSLSLLWSKPHSKMSEMHECWVLQASPRPQPGRVCISCHLWRHDDFLSWPWISLSCCPSPQQNYILRPIKPV